MVSAQKVQSCLGAGMHAVVVKKGAEETEANFPSRSDEVGCVELQMPL